MTIARLFKSLSVSFFAVFVLMSCGYKLGYGRLHEKMSITVPYVEGDVDGLLTSAIVKQLTLAGCFDYKTCQASHLLRVKIVDFRDENVGFRYYRKKRGRLTNSLIPTETRLEITAEVSLLDAGCNQVILGPVLIFADMDFDHDYYTSRDAINIFSLGQLSDIDDASDTARKPLNEKLAQKIVDFILEN